MGPEAEEKVCPRCAARYDAVAVFCQHDGARLVVHAEEPDPYIGRVLLDQFRIEEVLGTGGMGRVYRARQTGIDRDVAIKILHPELIQNPDAVRRFQREAKVSSSLDHPNVVRVFLFGQLPDHSLYLVMEYLRGRSLLELLRAEGTPILPRALHIATQICDAVGEAHTQGVVHRDVKPENVLLVPRGGDPDFVKVLDFGIARFLDAEQTAATKSGLIFGTARYISPEGAAGEPTDARSDVYSIAVLTYQLLVGRTPFDAASPVGLLMKHIHEQAPDLRQLPGGSAVPGPVADVIMRSLAKNPDARPAHARELGELLRATAATAGIPVAGPRFSAHPSPYAGGLTPAPSPMPVAYGVAPSGRPTPTTGPMGEPAAPPHDTGHLTVPGLSRRRGLGVVPTVMLAFVLGVAAVIGGAWAVTRLTGGPGPVAVEELESRARSALARGDLDRPPGDNVAELTARILADDPEHAGATELRREAARRLRIEAGTVLAQGLRAEARERYERALAFDPDDAAARRGLEELEQAASAPASSEVPEEGVRMVPAEASEGEPVTFAATVATPIAEEDRPHFHLARNGRRLTRAIAAEADGDDGRSWMATYTFRHHGDYELVFNAAGDVALRAPIEIDRAAQARRYEPPVTTQQRAPRAEPAVSTEEAGDGIDWRLPDGRSVDDGAEDDAASASDTNDGPVEPSSPVEDDSAEVVEGPNEEPEAPPAPWTSGDLL